MPSTPPRSTPPTSPPGPTSPADPTSPPGSRLTVARRVAMAVVAGGAMAGLTVATAGQTAPATARGVAGAPATGRAGGAGRVHIESVAAPVLVTAVELRQAEVAAAVTAGPANPAPANPAPANPAPANPAPAARPADTGTGAGGADLGTFLVTCYDLHGRTATGDQAGPDSVAVDPSVIPLGSQIYIAGVGYRRADDTGGGVRGHHVDIWASNYSACAAFGRRYRDVRRLS